MESIPTLHSWSIRDVGRHLCGAAIISPQVLLTAGHCLYGARKAAAFKAGHIKAIVRSTRSGEGPLISLAHYVIHPDYLSDEVMPELGDLALIFLSHNITGLLGGSEQEDNDSQPLANTVCMPEDDAQFGEYVTYEKMGFTSVSGDRPFRLQTARVRTPSPIARLAGIECGRQHQVSVFCEPERHILIHNGRNSRTNACRGDSGGPLVGMTRSRATLAGILTRQLGGLQFGGHHKWFHACDILYALDQGGS